jgi:hypothetical protein
MDEQKPTLDYRTPTVRTPVPLDYVLAAGCSGVIIGAILLGTIGFVFLNAVLPPRQFDTEEGTRSVYALLAGGLVGLVLGIVIGVRRWRRS